MTGAHYAVDCNMVSYKRTVRYYFLRLEKPDSVWLRSGRAGSACFPPGKLTVLERLGARAAQVSHQQEPRAIVRQSGSAVLPSIGIPQRICRPVSLSFQLYSRRRI